MLSCYVSTSCYPLKLEALLLTFSSRPFFPWLTMLPAPGLTGGVTWWPAAWFVLEETDSWLAAMWVFIVIFNVSFSTCKMFTIISFRTKSKHISPQFSRQPSYLVQIFCQISHLSMFTYRETLVVPWTVRTAMAPGLSMVLWALAQAWAATTPRSHLSSLASVLTSPGSTM